MSYLDPVRLHFDGQFQADVSTVNNVTQYYRNDTFQAQYDQKGGEWHPTGSGAWRLVDCRVTRVCYADGTSTTDPKVDPAVGLRVADANKRVSGKLVDLDPQQQMASQIWTLLVRLTDGVKDFVSGPFATAAFMNLWVRATEEGNFGQQTLGASYQSVLAPLAWGDTSGSRFLTELRAATMDGMLSIKFNLDGYDRDDEIPTFTLGRIAGSIGPAHAGEPHHFVLGRQLGGTDPRMNYMPCVVDARARRLTADFGNSIQTLKPGGDMKNAGAITIGWVALATRTFNAIGQLSYLDSKWYSSTAGVQDFALDDYTIAALRSNPVAVAIDGTVVLQENLDGWYVRADRLVYRLSAGETADVQLYATRYGVLQDGAPITVLFDPSELQKQVGKDDPPVATPNVIGGFDPSTPIIARDGRATLQLTTGNPNNPRGYIDGQVYGIRPLPQAIVGSPPGPWINRYEFISLLVWDDYKIPDAPTWWDHVEPIFTQYGHLYPLMDKLMDLTSYDAVTASPANLALLTFAFSLPEEDPNSMPVTRDLSPAKRKTILRWLTTPGPDGKPLVGQEPPRPFILAPVEAPVSPTDPMFLLKSRLEKKP